MEGKRLNNDNVTLRNYDQINDHKIPNPKKGLLLSILLGFVGAIFWAVIVKVSGYNLGIAAIAVGYIVSQGFVWAGKGDSTVWGVVAAVIATLSILLGKMLATIFVVTEYYGVTLYEMMQVIDYGQLMQFMVETFEGFDLVFYAIALQTAYKRSFTQASKNYADYMKPKSEDSQTIVDSELNAESGPSIDFTSTSESRTESRTETSYDSIDDSAFNDTAYEDTGERTKRPVATPESEAR